MDAYRSIGLSWIVVLLVGVGSTIASEACNDDPADVIFLLDASSSIWGPHFDKQVAFVKDVINQFDIRPSKTRCGLITFSDDVRVEFELGEYNDLRTLNNALKYIDQLQGATRTDLALLRMDKMFKEHSRRGIPKLAIVLTDGESEYTGLTAVAAQLVHEHGVTVFSVGIGKGVNAKELVNIATSEGFAFEVDSFEALDSIREVLPTKACNLGKGQQGDAPPPTLPTKGCNGKPADIVFVLDASTSIWQNDFDKQMTFVKDVVRIFEISSEATRVGILTFGDDAKPQFNLHRYMDPDKLERAIGRVKQNLGNTNTAAALHTMRKRFFSKKRAREGVVHIGVVITDGQSDNPEATAREARLARDSGIQMFVIGVGHNVDQRELYNIASEPTSQHVFEVNTYEALGSIKNLLAMKTCEITEPPTTINPTTSKATTTTTTTPLPPKGCSTQLPADIVFAVPNDATVAESNHALKLIRDVTRELDLDSDAIRFGLVPKQCYTVPGFSLKIGSTRQDVVNMVSSSRTQNRRSGSVIEHMCDTSFQSVKGARNNSTKIGVVFVDTTQGPTGLIQTAGEAERARQEHGVEVILVGVGSGVSENELSTLVGPHTEKNIFTVQNYADLQQVAGSLVQRFDDLCLGSPSF